MDSPPPLGVVLSAGASLRMGEPKALLRLPDGRTLLQAHVDALLPVCSRVVVVGGAHTPALRASLGAAVTWVHNPDWQTTWPADSLALALVDTGAAAALVTPVDAAPAPLTDLLALARTAGPAVLCWQGQPGHPVRLDQAVIARVCSGPLPGGLRTLLRDAAQLPGSGPDVLQDLDTPARWRAWLASL